MATLEKDTSVADSQSTHLDALHSAVSANLLPCSTVLFPVKAENLVLYYGKDNAVRLASAHVVLAYF